MGLASAAGIGRLGLALQPRLVEQEDEVAGQHADPGEAEARVPADRSGRTPAEDRGPERAQIDAVVVEGEARVAPRIALDVELADDRRDVGLEEPDAHDDQGQRQVEDVDEALMARLDGGRRWPLGSTSGSGAPAGRPSIASPPRGVGDGVAPAATTRQTLRSSIRPSTRSCRSGRGRSATGRRRPFDRHGEVAGDQQQGAERDGLAAPSQRSARSRRAAARDRPASCRTRSAPAASCRRTGSAGSDRRSAGRACRSRRSAPTSRRRTG